MQTHTHKHTHTHTHLRGYASEKISRGSSHYKRSTNSKTLAQHVQKASGTAYTSVHTVHRLGACVIHLKQGRGRRGGGSEELSESRKLHELLTFSFTTGLEADHPDCVILWVACLCNIRWIKETLRRWLGSATLLQLAFPGKANRISHGNNPNWTIQ